MMKVVYDKLRFLKGCSNSIILVCCVKRLWIKGQGLRCEVWCRFQSRKLIKIEFSKLMWMLCINLLQNARSLLKQCAPINLYLCIMLHVNSRLTILNGLPGIHTRWHILAPVHMQYKVFTCPISGANTALGTFKLMLLRSSLTVSICRSERVKGEY